MPKATKNTNTATSAPSVDTIKQEWLNVVKDITDINEKLDHLCKRRDELVSQLWVHLNKDPASTVLDNENVPEKAPTKKAPTKKNDEQTSSTPVKKPPTTVSGKKSSKTSNATVAEENSSTPTPATGKKVPVKKGSKVKQVEDEDTPVLENTPTKAPTKKISAPSKGTPKPKLEIDSEDVNQNEEPSSEETDLDSLSSVSSESDASGGEDN